MVASLSEYLTTHPGATPRWDSYPPLATAIRKRLFADSRPLMRTTFTAYVPDAEQAEKLDAVKQRLISERGYCAACATALLDYAPELIAE